MKKRLLSLLLAAVMCAALVVPAAAAQPDIIPSITVNVPGATGLTATFTNVYADYFAPADVPSGERYMDILNGNYLFYFADHATVSFNQDVMITFISEMGFSQENNPTLKANQAHELTTDNPNSGFSLLVVDGKAISSVDQATAINWDEKRDADAVVDLSFIVYTQQVADEDDRNFDKREGLWNTPRLPLSGIAAEAKADWVLDPAAALAAANRLYQLGLFNGVGTNPDGTPNYDLDRAPTRHEAVTLLVRLLGKDAEAKAGSWQTPFTDVEDWAKPYVGYAYENGLTSGVSATAFGGASTVSATQYLTFVLRAMGYTSGTDFQWDKAWELTDQLGITDGQYATGTAFTRGDTVVVSADALDVKLKDGSKTLLEAIEEALANAQTPPAPPAPSNTVTLTATAQWMVGDPQRPGYAKMLESPLTATFERVSDYEALITWQTDFSWKVEEVSRYAYAVDYHDATGALGFRACFDYSRYSDTPFEEYAYISDPNDDTNSTAFTVTVLQEDPSAGLCKLRITLPQGSARNLGMLDLSLLECTLDLGQ